MGFAYLLRTPATSIVFRVRFNIPQDVEVEFCPEGNIENDRLLRVVFFPLMLILEGGVRFLVNLILLKTLSFYGLSSDQCFLNFYRVVNSVIRLNNLYGLELNHHDINFMYGIHSSIKIRHYLKIRNPTTRLISCVPDSNRNSTWEFIKVSGN